MNILASKQSLSEIQSDVIVIGAYLGSKKESILCCDIDVLPNGFLLQILKEDQFRAKEEVTMLVRTDGRIPTKRILVVGLGKKDELDLSVIRRAAAQAFSAVSALGLKNVSIVPFGTDYNKLDFSDCIQSLVEGMLLSSYSYIRYKKKTKKTLVEAIKIFVDGRFIKKTQNAIGLAELMSSATIVARDLVNTPALHLSPKDLVNSAKDLVKGNKDIAVKVFNKTQLQKIGAGGLLSVNQGSDHEPFMVHMIYKPKEKSKKRIALVGKAVTFDSGGLSLKPADSMTSMKIDMGGAAAVLGVFSVLAKLKPKVEVHGIFGAVENMPSGKAIRPGDIVTAMNGKTIEILNTDAEGRVTLADTLSYACKLKPDMVIDLATLTGACMVALGEEITGLMSNNPMLAQRLLAASSKAGEPMWELPLYKGYRSLILSDIADVKNIGGRYGGALTAGLFLQEFVEKNMPWVHLDIAGPVFAERPFSPYEQKGATGHPVRTLIHFLRSY